MAIMIEITKIEAFHNTYNDRRHKIFVDVNDFSSISGEIIHGKSIVGLKNGQTFYCAQTPEEIVNLLKEHGFEFPNEQKPRPKAKAN